MAERRMFSKMIIDSDAFLEMPLSTQALYFHLSMRADDDGFLNNPKKIQKITGATDDDLKLLMAKRFILLFESGVIVIKHWKMHNYIRMDRYKPTVYQEEKKLLEIKENGSYSDGMSIGIPDDNQRLTQVRLGKVSIGYCLPTVEEIAEYCKQRNNNIDADHFYDYYAARGWLLKNGVKMKDWKAAVRTWEKRDAPKKSNLREVTDEWTS